MPADVETGIHLGAAVCTDPGPAAGQVAAAGQETVQYAACRRQVVVVDQPDPGVVESGQFAGRAGQVFAEHRGLDVMRGQRVDQLARLETVLGFVEFQHVFR